MLKWYLLVMFLVIEKQTAGGNISSRPSFPL